MNDKRRICLDLKQISTEFIEINIQKSKIEILNNVDFNPYLLDLKILDLQIMVEELERRKRT